MELATLPTFCIARLRFLPTVALSMPTANFAADFCINFVRFSVNHQLATHALSSTIAFFTPTCLFATDFCANFVRFHANLPISRPFPNLRYS